MASWMRAIHTCSIATYEFLFAGNVWLLAYVPLRMSICVRAYLWQILCRLASLALFCGFIYSWMHAWIWVCICICICVCVCIYMYMRICINIYAHTCIIIYENFSILRLSVMSANDMSLMHICVFMEVSTSGDTLYGFYIKTETQTNHIHIAFGVSSAGPKQHLSMYTQICAHMAQMHASHHDFDQRMRLVCMRISLR
jgi:hypothetical protein